MVRLFFCKARWSVQSDEVDRLVGVLVVYRDMLVVVAQKVFFSRLTVLSLGKGIVDLERILYKIRIKLFGAFAADRL